MQSQSSQCQKHLHHQSGLEDLGTELQHLQRIRALKQSSRGQGRASGLASRSTAISRLSGLLANLAVLCRVQMLCACVCILWGGNFVIRNPTLAEFFSFFVAFRVSHGFRMSLADVVCRLSHCNTCAILHFLMNAMCMCTVEWLSNCVDLHLAVASACQIR